MDPSSSGVGNGVGAISREAVEAPRERGVNGVASREAGSATGGRGWRWGSGTMRQCDGVRDGDGVGEAATSREAALRLGSLMTQNQISSR
jgi:hypothetical protein